MKKILLYLWIFFPLSVFGNTFTDTEIDSHRIQYVTYDISSNIYDIHIWISKKGANLREIMRNYGGVTAINGVFFCPADYTQCKGQNSTINERFIEGREISTYKNTGERVVFGWNEKKEAFLHQTGKINIDKRGGIYEWFANFPLLLESGENKLEHYYDVWLIGRKMRVPLTRHFICTNESRDKIIFWRVLNAVLDDVVRVISQVGCYDALNLDAGKSSSFIYNGRNLSGPGRDILDGVIISRNDIDIRSIDTKISAIFSKITRLYLKKVNKTKSIKELQNYRVQLTKIRKKLYERYSTDVKDDLGGNIWYTIDITSQKAFKKIYLINLVDSHIKELIYKLGK